MDPQINHVSDTALWVATYRAEESARPDALFHDPLAGKLAGDRGKQISKNVVGSIYTRWNVVLRTCIIDRFVTEQVAAGVDLVVNLGAGLDTRPYRLRLPQTIRWVEVDFPHVIDAKEKALAGEQPLFPLERRRVDLSDAAARGAFLDEMQAAGKKILVITEGVIPYLSNEQVAELARDLRARDHFKFWVTDYMSAKVTEYLQKGKFRKQLRNAPFQFAPGDWFGFFRNLGWKEKEVRYLADESIARGRAIPTPFLMKLVLPFLSEEKRQELRRFTAYVLLEPVGA